MEREQGGGDKTERNGGTNTWGKEWRALGITLLLAGVSVFLMLLPSPAGLTPAGQRVLAVAFLAIGLWCTGAIPAAVTGILVVISLALSQRRSGRSSSRSAPRFSG